MTSNTQTSNLEHLKVYFPHDKYIWISGEIISEIKTNEYIIKIDDFDIPIDIIQSLTTYNGKLDSLPLQNINTNINGIEDMCNLNFLHEASILHNLKQRFHAIQPYTYVGNICIAINPYQWIDSIYSNNMKDLYYNTKQIDLMPHIYAISTNSYKNLLQSNQNQSILVSGESGAGKTETVKLLLSHLAYISNNNSNKLNESIIVKRILQANPLLESFG